MTTTLPDVQQTPQLIESHPARLGRSWLILGALGVAMGLGYAVAHKFTAFAGASSPAPDEAVAAPVVQNGTEEPELGGPVAAAFGAHDPTDEVADDEGQATDEAPAAQPPASGAYHVQVASYKAEQDAAEYASSLSARGVAATSSPDPSGKSWHVVRLGPFQNRGEAEKARFKLKLNEREKAYVMPRSNGKYHVQVGSFASLPEAEGVAKRFDDLGHVTKISRVKMGDRRWHCVRIGPFDTAQEAADYQELVKGVANTESVVIPYGPPKG